MLPDALLSGRAGRGGDRYSFAQRTRFLPQSVLRHFNVQLSLNAPRGDDDEAGDLGSSMQSRHALPPDERPLELTP